MELYGLDEDVARQEALLQTLTGPDRLSAQIALAWYLRQRDCARALELVADCMAWLATAAADRENTRARARLDLVLAEVALLRGQFEEGQAGLNRAFHAFAALGDQTGLGDTELTAHLLHQFNGVTGLAATCAAKAERYYAEGADAVRRKAAESWLLLTMAYRDIDAAEQRLRSWAGIPAGTAAKADDHLYGDEHPAVASVLLSAWAVIYSARNESAQAMLCAARASHRADRAGLVRQSIASADNAGWYLQELGDLDAAAEWMDKEFAAARASGWPPVLAFSTTRFGELLRHLGQFERSREVLVEAIALHEGTTGGINKGVAYRVLGQTLLALGRPEEALAAYGVAVELFRLEGYHDRLANALIGAALSLSAANRPGEALERIAEASAITSSHRIQKAEIELARALAEIHAHHALPPPDDRRGPTAAVHYLELALGIGRALDSWQAPVDLLTALSTAWEEVGDEGRALAYLKQAMAAERREGNRKAAHRTLALQIRHETEQAQLEMLHSRQLAAAEAERAGQLEAALAEARELQIELERRRAEFERLSLLDALTGVANRRHFSERAKAEISRARRDGAALGVGIFDIDHFKRVNDQYGHAAGDSVLQHVVDAVRAQLRPSDFVARLGGEEFALLIPGVDATRLRDLAERVRRAVGNQVIATEVGRICVTASFGLSCLSDDETEIEPAVSRADAALYQAKTLGRNRIAWEG